MKKLSLLVLVLLTTQFINPIFSQVVINEFSAANFGAFTDNYGEDEDWIELYNTGSSTVDLAGYHLSDKIDNPTKFAIPSGVSIGAGQHLLIWVSDRDEYIGGNLHTSFKITQTRNSEAIVFAAPDGTILDLHDLDIPNQVNHSWARQGDGNSSWGVATIPSPGNPNTDVSEPYAAKPTISPAAGAYSGSVDVSIAVDDTDLQIYYTIDGSFPTTASTLYSGPFVVHSTTVVKAVAVSSDPDTPNSFIDFHTFLLDENHTIPVVSVAGSDLPALLDGSFIEPVGTFELFDATGQRVADATGDYNKHGNDSWAYDQRGIDYITRDQFGYDYAVKHEIFDAVQTDRDKFQRLILKAAANDNYPFEGGGAHIRDAYVHTLSQKANLELDERTYEPCVMYVNGEYWGVYEMREKVDDNDYTSYYYDQGREWIDFLKTWGGTWEEYGTGDDWYPLVDFITNNDMSDPVNYAYVDSLFEVISLIDYVILHSHNVSMDWLNWNTGWWRGRKPDGQAKKWRYILWDEDATFGHYINYTGVPDVSANADPCNPEILDDPGGQGHIPIFNALLTNEDFLALYISRYADLNNTYFTCDYMIGLLDSLIGRIEPEMPRQIQRWGGTMGEWQSNVQELRDFINERCTVISDGIVDCYEDLGITGPYTLTINVEPAGSGDVQANTLSGLNYPWVAEYFGGINFDLTAIPANADWVFSHWEVNNHAFTPDQFSEAISMSLDTDDEITAFFQPAVPCGIPFGFVIDSTFTSLDINWAGPNNGIGYEVHYRALGTTDWDVFNTVDPETMVTGLDECTFYEFEIRAICDFALSSFEPFIAKTSCNITSTNDPIDLISATVFPNPFQQDIHIELALSASTDINIELLSITGQRIASYSFEDQIGSGVQVLNIQAPASLPQGMYLIAINSDSGSIVQKVIKQ